MTIPDANVFLVNFPAPGSEMVSPNDDGTYTILINARLTHERQVEAYQHAMKHIMDNDFEKENVQEIESTAHSEH